MYQCESLWWAPRSDPLHVWLNETESEAMGNHLEELGQTGNDMWAEEWYRGLSFPPSFPMAGDWARQSHTDWGVASAWEYQQPWPCLDKCDTETEKLTTNKLETTKRNRARKRQSEINALKKRMRRNELRQDKKTWKHEEGSVWYNVSGWYPIQAFKLTFRLNLKSKFWNIWENFPFSYLSNVLS